MVQWFQKWYKGQFEENQFVKTTSVCQNGLKNAQILKIELALSNNYLKKRPKGYE